MDWQQIVAPLVIALVGAIATYIAKRSSGAWKEVAESFIDKTKELKLTGHRVSGEELAGDMQQRMKNKMTGFAADCLQYGVDKVNHKRDRKRKKPKNAAKRAGKAILRSVTENAVTGLVGRLFKKRK